MTLKEMLEAAQKQLREKLEERETLTTKLQDLRSRVDGESAPSSEEVDKAIAARDALDSPIRELEADVERLGDELARDEAAAALHRSIPAPAASSERQTGSAQVTDPDVYERGNGNSFFRDLFMGTQRGDRDAYERMQRNNAQVNERAIGTGATAGGEFAPPGWLIDQYQAFARPGRVTADLLQHQDLPSGVSSLPVPKVTTGATAAEQSAEGDALSEGDLVTSSADSKVFTVGGLQTVALQLIDQSPINVDELVFGELSRAHAQALDAIVLNGSGTGKKGLLQATGINTVTWTEGSPTVPLLWPKLVDGQQQVHAGRFLPAEAVAMHPRRWAWFSSKLDANNRPYVSDVNASAIPLIAQSEGSVAEGYAGTIRGLNLPVFLDPNIPTNISSNQDAILVFRPSDSVLFESGLRAESFTETKAKEAQVVFRLFNYAAISAERAPKSISKIVGTGLTTPSF